MQDVRINQSLVKSLLDVMTNFPSPGQPLSQNRVFILIAKAIGISGPMQILKYLDHDPLHQSCLNQRLNDRRILFSL